MAEIRGTVALGAALDFVEDAKNNPALRYLLFEGSTRSSKTYSLMQAAVILCLKPDMIGEKEITLRIYRNDATTTADSVVLDMMDVLQRNDLFSTVGIWNASRKIYKFWNGSMIAFMGAKDSAKAHGKKATISWLNEVMEIGYDAYRQITFRTERFIWADWNPSLSKHWVFTNVMQKPEAYRYLHTTYRDNPYLTASQVAEIESVEPTEANIRNGTADSWYWQVYGLGKRGLRPGSVYDARMWEATDDWPDRMLCQAHGYALDYGYSQDPSTLVECALYNDVLWAREIFYEPRLLVTRNAGDSRFDSIQQRLEDAKIPKNVVICADSAAAESNQQLRLLGWNVIDTEKGAGSINEGINLVKQQRMAVARASQNIQNELEQYVYRQLPDGTFSADPVDKNNHAMDAIRYWCKHNLRARLALMSKAKPRKTYNPDTQW